MLLLVTTEFLRKIVSSTIRYKISRVSHLFPKVLSSCLSFSVSSIELYGCLLLTGSIRVYCRVRPFLSGQSSYLSTVEFIEDGNIAINTPSKHGKGRRSFSFNKVFGPSATQGFLIESAFSPLLQNTMVFEFIF